MVGTEPLYDEEVEIPWGPNSSVRATVREVYGQTGRRHVVVLLTPKISGSLSLPISKVKRVAAATQ